MSLSNVETAIYEAGVMLLVIAGIPLSITMMIGLLISILQAATQIQEQTLTFVPKLIAMLLLAYFVGAQLVEQMTEYSISLLNGLPELARSK